MFNKSKYNKQYRLAHSKETKEYFQEYHKVNKEQMKAYRATRKDKQKAYDKEYYKLHAESAKTRAKARYAKDPIKLREQNKQLRRQDRYEAIKHYSHGTMKCASCGCDKYVALTIDHMNNDGNKHRREIGTSTSIYRWLRKNKYPEGFQVLCYNCNVPKGREEELGLTNTRTSSPPPCSASYTPEALQGTLRGQEG